MVYTTKMISLVKRILIGDDKAVTEFYQEYSPRILKFLLKKLPEEDAQEIMNDVFLEAIDSLPMLKSHDKLLPWLYRIAHNNMVNFYRKKKFKSVLISQMPFLELAAKEMHQPEFIMEKNAIRDKIETVLHSISKKYRNILRMHYEEGLPIKKIAFILDLSPKACESLLYRARLSFIKEYERI